MGRLHQFVQQQEPYFAERIDPRNLYLVFIVEPQQSLERIKAKSGAFLVSAFHSRFEQEKISEVNPDIPINDHHTLRTGTVIQRRAGRLPGRPLLRQVVILQMTYSTPNDFAAIALSALNGASIAVSFQAGESGSDGVGIVVFAVTVILCPSVAGYLYTRSRNVVLYPVTVLVGLIIVVPSVEMDSHPTFWVANTTLLYGSVACLAFFAG